MSSSETNTGPAKGVPKMDVTRGTTHVGSPPLTTSDRKPRVKTEQPGESGLSTTAKIALGLAIVGAEAGGVAIDQQIDNEPASLKNIAVQSATWPWDMGKTADEDIQGRFFGKETVSPIFGSNAGTQIVKTGPDGNAKAATPEQIQDFLNQTPPVFEKPKVGEQAPKVEILIPVNLENTSSIKIVQNHVDTKGGNEASMNYYYFDQTNFYLEKDSPFALPLVPGTKTVELKIEANQYRISDIVAIYTLNDGQTIKGNLALWGNNYIPTDTLKSIPRYDPNIVTSPSAREAIAGKKFDLKNNPHILLFKASDPARITFTLQNEQSALSPTPKTDEGKALYQPTATTTIQE